MSTERVVYLANHLADHLANHPGGLAGGRSATQIAAQVGKQAAARADVDVRYVGAEDAIARSVARSTATESYPYSSFEEGGVRRFERSPFARRPFGGAADLPPFRVY
jgi:hypothetical protein